MTGPVLGARRRLLASAAAAGGLALLSPALRAGSPTQAVRWDETRDVIVVGAGYAGLAAAIEAAQAGADVLVIEKMDSPGGNSALSTGDMAAPGTDIQVRLGITSDSAEVMYEDLMRTGEIADPVRCRIVAEGALDAWRWTRDALGVAWAPDALQSDERQTFPRGAIVRSRSGRELISAELDMLTRLRVPVRCLARLEALIPSPGDDRIEGVLVREGGVPDVPASGAPRRIRARRGVVLATGGFGADAAFLRSVAPELPPGIPTDNHPGATAEALAAAMRAGAAVRDLGEVQVLPWISADEIGIGSAWSFIEHVTTRHGVWITDRGERFVDESASQAVRARAVTDVLAKGGRVLALVDGSGFAQPGNVGAPVGDWEDLVRRGVIRRSATLAEAARRARIPREAAPALEETVARWNAVVRGEAADAFGRIPEKGAMVLADAPWHVVGICPKVHHTMGGLVIDASARVLWADGSVIAGLFAAGESTGGTFGRNRAPCHSSTDAIVTGRIAGREAARRS